MVVAKNKKAFHDYFIEDRYEAGVELFGAEVKSIKNGKASIKESFIRIIKGEIFIMGMHVTPYENSSMYTPNELSWYCVSALVAMVAISWVQILVFRSKFQQSTL